ncbi:hypothetical protein P7B02_04075 [Caulobacter segnis]|uniref:hypothetical protein n=1 Tax=Caulobacter segnis TaxID=88688 RepID=UPI00240F4194|nr:hypothetical protein [Caulobacter segnis]MDG2520710.1 hypothetical protein [Caulobacter segnis]
MDAANQDAARQARIALTCLRFIRDCGAIARGERDPHDAFILSAIANASLTPVNRDPEANTYFSPADQPPPDELLRPISINAVAQSLGMPFETVRRRIGGLAREGLIAVTPAGVMVLSSTISSPAYVAMLTASYDRAGQFYRDMRALNAAQHVPSPTLVRQDDGPPVRVVGRAISDYFLRTAHILMRFGGNLPTAAVLVEIVLENTADLDDAGLTQWISASGAAGRPARIADIARPIRFSGETARRYVNLLQARGLVVRGRSGFFAVTPDALKDLVAQAAAASAADARRFFSILDRSGVLAAWA